MHGSAAQAARSRTDSTAWRHAGRSAARLESDSRAAQFVRGRFGGYVVAGIEYVGRGIQEQFGDIKLCGQRGDRRVKEQFSGGECRNVGICRVIASRVGGRSGLASLLHGLQCRGSRGGNIVAGVIGGGAGIRSLERRVAQQVEFRMVRHD